MIKTFRGLLADGGQDRIRLQTIKGKVGYKINKFQIMPNEPGIDTLEAVVKIFSKEQGTIDGKVNFTDSDLLGAAYYQDSNAIDADSSIIIFDTEIFNQDIFVTYKEKSTTAEPCNYYLELEVIPLDDAGAEYTTLKDLRQI